MIYIVEDDRDIASLMAGALTGAGYESRIFNDASRVLDIAAHERPQLFVLDVMLPGQNGLELCRRIRQSKQMAHLPIMVVSARVEENDLVAGLELGADDYLRKPFSPREFVARANALLRRFEKPLQPGVLTAGRIALDSSTMGLSVDGQSVPTTATEFRLLEFLMRNAGRVYSRDQLLDSVWQDNTFVTPRSVDVYIRRLREKIEPDAEDPEYLKTKRGFGYYFHAPARRGTMA